MKMTLRRRSAVWREALETRTRRIVFTSISVVCNLFIATLIVYAVSRGALLISGSDSMYHVYRGDWVLTSIESGDKWPLYNPVWYNGVELMRYWPPLAAYTMAFCQFICRSLPSLFPSLYVFEGFALYCGVVYLIGALSWNIIGVVKRRPVMGAITGVLWFFMPQSLYVMFNEGNLPRSLIMAIFPLMFMFMNEFLKKGGKANYAGTAIAFAFIVSCHVGYAGMVAIACIIYLIVYRLCCFSGSNRIAKSGLRDLKILTAVLAGFIICGIFLIPTVKGGLVSNSSNTDQTARLFFQSVFTTLNPVGKIRDNWGTNYFGIISFALAVFGVIAGKRRSRAGFITAAIIVLLTSDSASPVIRSLPGGQFMWMLRFLQIAQAMILYSLLEWDSLKKPFVTAVTIALALDCAVSYQTLLFNTDYPRVEDFYEAMEENTLIDEAKALTTNRMAIIDSSRPLFNSTFYLTDYEGGVNQIFGQGWEAASTAGQIAQINEAYDNGYYYFMFDRLSELGCDTVLVRKDASAYYMFVQSEADEAAAARGYVKKYDEGNYSVYHLDGITGQFGTVSYYNGLAIGDGAYYITMIFPSIQEAPSEYIDDFSLEELCSYDVIYLDGFMYHDVETAESLITQAAESGTRVYVLADGIPENEQSRTNRFLGVECHTIEFDTGYPTLKTRDYGNFDVPLFPDECRQWSTVYINGLDEVLGWSEILDETFPFYGTAVNDNITFVAFNLTYYYSVTWETSVGRLLSGIIDTSISELPQRQFVPLQITYSPNSITIESPSDNVNSALAVHDIFEGDYKTLNRLIYVHQGTNTIEMHYPYVRSGIYLSLLGVLTTALLTSWFGKKDPETLSKDQS